MPKPNIKTAPDWVQRRIAMVRETDSVIRAIWSDQTFNVPAAGVLAAIQTATQLGYSWPVEDVPTPATRELRELEKAAVAGVVGAGAVAKFRVQNSFHLRYEASCVRKAQSLERWASEPSAAELAEAERPERERRELDAAIEQRAGELAENAEAKRLASVKAKAREQAQKEIEHV